jgi:hypothetical protein
VTLSSPVGAVRAGSGWKPRLCAVRRHLLDERGMDRQQLYTRGYWKLGAADHPDHDTGED